MYTFEAIYISMDTNEARNYVVYVDTNVTDSMTEKDAFCMAMALAYDEKHDNELLGSLEFISA